jgi:hypothetical protein
VNEEAVKKKALKIFLKSDYFFGGGILNLLKRSTIPKEIAVKDIGLVAYDRGNFTPHHLDGAMAGAALTLLEGKKTWNIYGPGTRSKNYTVHQEAGQTLYVPPGFSHEVTSEPPRSIAYNGIWDSPPPLALSVFVGNRKFLRSSSKSHKEEVVDDMKAIHTIYKQRKTGKRKNESDIDFLLRIASKENCKREWTSTTRRRKDGRLRTRGRIERYTRKSKRKQK